MRVNLYDAACVEETQYVGDTTEGVPIPRVGETVYGLTYKMRGTVSKVSYHHDNNTVLIHVDRV
jgi:hypothetical protein